MAVNFYNFFQTTSSIPNTTAAADFTDGFYVQQGTLQYLIVKLEVDITGTEARSTDLSALISKCRVVIDGQTWFDYVSAAAPAAGSTLQGRFGHFLNSIGGKCFTAPTGVPAADEASVLAFMGIPLGCNLTSNTPRFEVSIGYHDANLVLGSSATIGSSTLTYIGQYNSASEQSVMVINPTSHTYAGSDLAEQTVVRVPQMMDAGWKVLGCYIQNDTEADEYSTGGAIRQLDLSQFGLSLEFQQWASGEMANGSAYNAPASDTTAQIYASGRAGCLFVPLYNLKAEDITFIISSSAATTRLLSPVLVRSTAGIQKPQNMQTAASPANPSRQVIARTEADA